MLSKSRENLHFSQKQKLPANISDSRQKMGERQGAAAKEKKRTDRSKPKRSLFICEAFTNAKMHRLVVHLRPLPSFHKITAPAARVLFISISR